MTFDEAKHNWMVIGYSRTEGEYPVRLRISKADAIALAKEHGQKQPQYQDRASCMFQLRAGFRMKIGHEEVHYRIARKTSPFRARMNSETAKPF